MTYHLRKKKRPQTKNFERTFTLVLVPLIIVAQATEHWGYFFQWSWKEGLRNIEGTILPPLWIQVKQKFRPPPNFCLPKKIRRNIFRRKLSIENRPGVDQETHTKKNLARRHLCPGKKAPLSWLEDMCPGYMTPLSWIENTSVRARRHLCPGYTTLPFWVSAFRLSFPFCVFRFPFSVSVFRFAFSVLRFPFCVFRFRFPFSVFRFPFPVFPASRQLYTWFLD